LYVSFDPVAQHQATPPRQVRRRDATQALDLLLGPAPRPSTHQGGQHDEPVWLAFRQLIVPSE